MKEKPILFNSEMVAAILDGRKIQTRRIVKACPGVPMTGIAYYRNNECKPKNKNCIVLSHYRNPISCEVFPPFEIGDKLWVKETFQPVWATDEAPPFGLKSPDGWNLHYPASEPLVEWVGENGISVGCKPSIHMPRWASRITLEITDIRLECLNDISEKDAQEEGVKPYLPVDDKPWVCGFRRLWDSIYADRGFGWDLNPWVWAVKFRRIKP